MRGAVILPLAAIAFGLAPSAHPALSQAAAKEAPMSQSQAEPADIAEPDAEVEEKLAEYDEHRAPLALKEAADAASLHDGQAPPDPALADALARQRIAGWLAILNRFKRDLAPGFDPEKPPARSVAPPPSASGAQMPPGVNPTDIKDPAQRQQYIAAIEQNTAARADYNRSATLSRAHAVIIERAPASIADALHTLAFPAGEAAALISAADITQADRDHLLTALQHP